jgi:hypothetical protein
MQDIVLPVPFNRDFYLRNQKLIWSLTLGDVSSGYIIYSIVTVLILAVGITVDRKGGPPIISLAGIIMFITMLLKLRELYRARKVFFAKTNCVADKFEQNQTIQIFRFTDRGIEYQDDYSETKLTWELFEPVSSIKNNLVLKLKEDEQIYLILSMEQIGAAMFNEIEAILIEKTTVND